MDLCEYLCIWAGLVVYKLAQCLILTWVASRLVLPVLIVMLIELAVLGRTTMLDFADAITSYYEKKMDELDELLHWFDRQPKLGVRTPSGWELVAATRSSNLGYQVRQFYPVVICNKENDDPLGPDHVSSVYNVEVRHRSQFFKTVTIWQVSLLNGGQKEVHQFDTTRDSIVEWPPNQCFESSGIILVLLYRSIFVYDVRYKKGQTFEYRQFGWAHRSWRLKFMRTLASISCLRRIWCDEHGKKVLHGWTVRTIGTEGYRIFPHTRLRLSLTNTVFEIFLSGEVRQVSSEGVVFSRHYWRNEIRPVRTSSAFGIFYEKGRTFNGRSMLFDESTNSYIYCANADALISVEAPFGYYFNVSSPNQELSRGLCPVFLNNRECIECSRDGTVFRYEFAPSTLKYLMVKAVFRANPDLRIRMSADDFRRETGIGGMQAHFRSCDESVALSEGEKSEDSVSFCSVDPE